MSTKLNGSMYHCISLTIQLNISHMFYTQLNDQIVLFQAIQFFISHLFAFSLNVKGHNLNIKHFYLTHWYIGDTTPSQGEPVINVIPQSSCINGGSPLNCLVSYLGNSLRDVLLLCGDVVGVFYWPSRLDQYLVVYGRLTIWHNIKSLPKNIVKASGDTNDKII